MRCPYLKEALVTFCAISPYGKMVPETFRREQEPICRSPAHVECPNAAGRTPGENGSTRCPFLREAFVQYCEAAPVRKFIPLAEEIASQCIYERHRTCSTYLEREPAKPVKRTVE